MPAIITHDLFGKDVYGETFDTIGGSRDAAEAFLLGNQGPDPLFFVAPDPRYRRVGKLASTLHRTRPAEFLVALKSAVRELRRTRLRAGLCVPLPAGQHGASTRHKPGERLVRRRCGRPRGRGRP